MKREIVQKLNELNKKFYQTVGQSFDDSRKQAWHGWEKVLEFIPEKENIKVLDLGCGNGRFGEFLGESLTDLKIDYTGIDSDSFLLKQAKNKLEKTASENINFTFKLEKYDIVFDDFDDQFTDLFDFIVLFGVMHHIPGSKNRFNLINKTSETLSENGVLIFTTWQFAENERLQKRIVHPGNDEIITEIGFDEDDLEENDYILDWQRGEVAYRYCHNYQGPEVLNILKEVNLKIVGTFPEDGKERNINRYWISRHYS